MYNVALFSLLLLLKVHLATLIVAYTVLPVYNVRVAVYSKTKNMRKNAVRGIK
jgi:uncharacterized protein (UPF0333 family)